MTIQEPYISQFLTQLSAHSSIGMTVEELYAEWTAFIGPIMKETACMSWNKCPGTCEPAAYVTDIETIIAAGQPETADDISAALPVIITPCKKRSVKIPALTPSEILCDAVVTKKRTVTKKVSLSKSESESEQTITDDTIKPVVTKKRIVRKKPTILVAEPVTEPVAEPVTEPVAEPVSETVAELVAEPVAEQIDVKKRIVKKKNVAKPVNNIETDVNNKKKPTNVCAM